MTTLQYIEVAVAVAMIGVAIWYYVKRGREDGSRGSQGAVGLLIIASIVAMHGLGLFEYRPSEGELARGAAPRLFH